MATATQTRTREDVEPDPDRKLAPELDGTIRLIEGRPDPERSFLVNP